MSDRELLELAAKAAGMHVLPNPWPHEDGWFFCEQHGKPALHFRNLGNAQYYSEPWMPLNDDGDALRLAVKLGLTISITTEAKVRPNRTSVWTYGVPQIQEPHGADPASATRCAIVRAAAEIGKAMP